MIREYILPLTGEMVNWSTVSGNPSNPVRPLGPHEFLESYTWPLVITEDDRKVRVSLVEFGLDKSQATYSIEAHQVFLDAFDVWLQGKDYTAMATELGKTQLVVPKDQELPDWAKTT